MKDLQTGEELDVDNELKEMLYDEGTGSIKCSEHEPLLLQLPGTLPFAEVKPHTAKALEEMIDRLSETESRQARRNPEDSMNDDSLSNNLGGQEAPKIGKLRIHKSGKVVMRI